MNQNHRIWSFIKAKGFYIALALCITGAGTAAWLTAQNTISGIREQQQKPPAVTEQGEGNQWDYEDILQQQTGGEALSTHFSLYRTGEPLSHTVRRGRCHPAARKIRARGAAVLLPAGAGR